MSRVPLYDNDNKRGINHSELLEIIDKNVMGTFTGVAHKTDGETFCLCASYHVCVYIDGCV